MKQQITIVEKIETYINKYVTFPDDSYSLPVALWVMGTFMFPDFDAYPYLVITSDTKRSGKTRLGFDLLQFIASNFESASGITYSTLFRAIGETKPVLCFDEAELLSKESADNMRLVLNVGYRKGQKIKRTIGNKVTNFDAYCPKIFILIGDVFDTLRDRSIVVRMKRGEPKERFTYENAKYEGEAIRKEIAEWIEANKSALVADYQNFGGLSFLNDRDEEIWSPLFVIGSRVVPNRLTELTRDAVDISTEKTAEKRTYKVLQGAEKAAEDDEFSVRLLRDLYEIMQYEKLDKVTTSEALEKLYKLNTGPWRKLRGKGLDARDMAALLEAHGVRPTSISVGKGRKTRKVLMGYKREQVEAAVTLLG